MLLRFIVIQDKQQYFVESVNLAYVNEMTSKLPLLRCPFCDYMASSKEDLLKHWRFVTDGEKGFDIFEAHTTEKKIDKLAEMIAEKQEPSQCEKDFKEEIEFEKWFQGKQEPQWCEHTIDMSKYIPVSKIEEKIKQYENIHYNKPNPEWIIRIEELKSLLPKK